MAGKFQDYEVIEQEIREIFKGRENELAVEYTEYSGHAKEIARKYAQTGDRVRLYACGGDGTLFEVVNGAYGYDNAEIAPVPKGSGNDFVKLYDKVKRPNITDMIEGDTYRMDVIKCDGEVALNCFTAGLDAEVAGLIAKLKRLPFVGGSLAYGIAAAIKLLRNKRHKFSFLVDGEKVEEGKYMFAAAMNGRFYGGGFNPTPNAVLDDGEFDFIRVKAMSYISIAGLVGKYKNGTHLEKENSKIELVRCKKIKFMCEKPILVTIDGEMRLKNSPEIEMESDAISIVFPKWAKVDEKLLRNCKKEAATY